MQRWSAFPADLGIGCAFFFGYFFRPVFLGQGTLARGFDGSVQSFPWLQKTVQAWQSFSVPLWDFGSFGGTTFIGELQPGALYPGHVVFAWLFGAVTQRTFNAYIAAHYVVAFACMALFLRSAGLSLLPRLLGSFAFAAYLDWSQPNRFFGMALLPLLLLCLGNSLRSGSPRPWRDPWVFGGGFTLAIMLLGGHQQPWAHGVIALAFLAALFSWRSHRRDLAGAALRLLSVVLISVLVTAPQWLLTLEYVRRAYRWAPDRILGFQRVSYQAFAHTDALSPELFHYISRSWVPLVAVAVLALIVFRGEPPGGKLPLLGLLLGSFAFLASLGDAGFLSRVTWHIPLFTIVRGAERYIFLVFFSAAVLVAVLGEWLLAPRADALRRWASRAAFLALAVWVYFHSQGLLRPQDDSLDLSPKRQFARGGIIRDLVSRHREEPFFRVFNFRQCLPRNSANAFGWLGVRGHRATIYAPYYDFVADALGDPLSSKHDRLGVRYVVSPEVLPLKLLRREADLFLYERPGAVPIFYRRREDGVLEPAPIGRVRWGENSVSVQLTGDFAGTLTFAQPAYPGWVAAVDGQSREVLDLKPFQGVRLNPGDRIVTFAYRPPLFLAGLGMALLPLIGLGMALGRAGRGQSLGEPA